MIFHSDPCRSTGSAMEYELNQIADWEGYNSIWQIFVLTRLKCYHCSVIFLGLLYETNQELEFLH